MLDMDQYRALLGPRTKLVGVAHVSNALGTINPVAEITRLAHDAGAKVLIDGAQAVAHQAVDVQAIDCDFYAFSGHKLYGPTGRSEEHTSELQSLMRISYSVFCLQKKNHTTDTYI